jgi:class 3 adenylate cyclase
MALFGAPIAHEDHAERAIHAALAIQAAMAEYGARLAREHRVEFRMRIGLNSGTVVVGRIGDNLRMDYTAQGDTVNLAARLEQVCAPGGVLVSETTRRLAAGVFAFRALPPVAIKGRDAYRRAVAALQGTLPRIPRPELRDTLLRSEPVARLLEEAARLGVTRGAG